MAHKITKHCEKCDCDFRVNNFAKHQQACTGPKVKKIRGIDFDPNHGYKDGTRKAWNKKPEKVRGTHGGYRERAGSSKNFYVNDSFGKLTCLQSSHELKLAQLLDEQKILWKREGCFNYDGTRRYFPDFHLTESNIYLDVKNPYLIVVDGPKIQKVREQNPDLKLLVFTLDTALQVLRENKIVIGV